MEDPAIPVVVRDHRSTRIWIARGLAVAADLIQIGMFPLTALGFVEPSNDIIDVVVAAALTYLVGWHIAFVPSFVIKLIPFAAEVPTWTLAVLIATRGQGKPETTLEALNDKPMA